jgi:RND family efflux transporter MFP subunit
VDFDVDERSLLDYQARQRAGEAPKGVAGEAVEKLKIPVWLGLATEKDFPHEGRLVFTENVVDKNTGNYQLRAIFDNADRILTPGLFARVRVQRGAPYPALLVPELAIGTLQSTKFVLVVDDKGIANSRTVELGEMTPDNYRVITKGIGPNDHVIVNGMLKVRPGEPVDASEEQPPADAGASLALPSKADEPKAQSPPEEKKAEGA